MHIVTNTTQTDIARQIAYRNYTAVQEKYTLEAGDHMRLAGKYHTAVALYKMAYLSKFPCLI
jgi:hypothetical protein